MATAAQAAELLATAARHAHQRLGERRAEIDRLNVFPVPDGDTGTNMYLTLESAVLALDTQAADRPDGALGERWRDAPPEVARLIAVAQALARGALLGARGNSGVILSQFIRGFLHARLSVRPDGGLDTAAMLASGLSASARLAYEAVGEPVEGTMLTVIRVAGETAERTVAEQPGAPMDVVLEAAADAAREALRRTPEQLPALAAAGVVDSGGAGVVAILDAFTEVITGRARPGEHLPAMSARDAAAVRPHQPHRDYRGPGYEVMYLLRAEDEVIPELRRRLSALGDSLVVVGGDGLWNVHVHVDDAGAAIEEALAMGAPHRIKVQWLREAFPHEQLNRSGRAVVAVSHGEGVSRLLAESGVIVVRARPRVSPSTGELLSAIEGADAAEVVVLPGGKDVRPAAEAAATLARESGIRVAVVPTRAIVQSLAAVAVHDPDSDFDDDVAAMSRAAGATRYGGVTVSSRSASTGVGECRPGDLIGLIGREVVAIGADAAEVAVTVVDRLVTSTSELVTLLAGEDLSESVLDVVAERVGERHPRVEVVAEMGGQPMWPLIIGVE